MSASGNDAATYPIGFLYSQVGYDLGDPVRFLLRGYPADTAPRYTVRRGEIETGRGEFTLVPETWHTLLDCRPHRRLAGKR